MEKIKLAYQDYYLGQHTSSGYTFQNAVDKMFGARVTTVTGNDTDGYTVTYNAKDYFISSTGSIQKLAKWNDNGDGTWTHSETGEKINIGDIVNYDPTKDASENTLTTTYTSYSTLNAAANKNEGRTSGYTKDQTFSVSASTNGWRVLGINENGQIELISADPIQTSSSSNYYLQGEKGYLYGVDELNAICGIFGQGKGAQSGRSLNMDDLDKLAGIKEDEDKRECNMYYGDKWKYRYPEDGSKMQYNKNIGSGYNSTWTNTNNNLFQKFRMPGAADSTEINSTNRKESPELTYTYYNYTISQKVTQTNISNLICKGTTSNNLSQWIASNCVCLQHDGVFFQQLSLYSGYVFGETLIKCYGDPSIKNRLIRPVVTLKSSVQLSGDSASGWTIQ